MAGDDPPSSSKKREPLLRTVRKGAPAQPQTMESLVRAVSVAGVPPPRSSPGDLPPGSPPLARARTDVGYGATDPPSSARPHGSRTLLEADGRPPSGRPSSASPWAQEAGRDAPLPASLARAADGGRRAAAAAHPRAVIGEAVTGFASYVQAYNMQTLEDGGEETFVGL